MRWGAQSNAAALVRPNTACFDAQYAAVSESVSQVWNFKGCWSKMVRSTISRSRRLPVNAREVYYPASVAVWQRILSHHLSSGSAAAVHHSRGIDAHGGGPVGIWHRPDWVRVLDLGRYTRSVYHTDRCLRRWSRCRVVESLTCRASRTSQPLEQQEHLYLRRRTRRSDGTELGRLRL
jgi:hypothetical protein